MEGNIGIFQGTSSFAAAAPLPSSLSSFNALTSLELSITEYD